MFLLYQNNVRKTWSVIKETLQWKKRHEMSDEFVWNNRVITDMTDIANESPLWQTSCDQLQRSQVVN